MLAEVYGELGEPCKYEHDDGHGRRMIAEE
jgi:hypothetical protein